MRRGFDSARTNNQLLKRDTHRILEAGCPAAVGSLLCMLIGLLLVTLGAQPPAAAAEPGRSTGPGQALPVRGLHLSNVSKSDLPALLALVRGTLAASGVNTLVLELDYQYNFQSRPEFANPTAPGKDDVRQIVQACRETGISLIPQINCLGHQSWARQNGTLLQKHPEFDETPGKHPGNEGIYCRSYCPLHPKVHAVLFDLLDELARDCEAKAVHVGMDEVFILSDPDCPRCKGRSPAELFAGEVNTLAAHLKSIGCRMWMWGDRFIDARSTHLGKWEASDNQTHPALRLVPKDIVICDWHYNRAPETLRLFTTNGFDVVACPWRKPAVALAQLAQIQAIRAGGDQAEGPRALGTLQTTWSGFEPFRKACEDQAFGGTPGTNAAAESAHCFRELFKALRQHH